MTGSSWLSILILAIYFAVLTFFTVRSARMKEKSMEEYAVAGRRFGMFFVMMTVVATLLVGSTYTGWFVWAGEEGLIAHYDIIYVAAGYLILYLFAKRVWVWGKKHNLLTQPDFIQMRYRSRPLTIIFSVLSVVIEAPWTIMEFATLGFLAQAITFGAIPKNVGMIIIVAFILFYIYYSGMRAVVVTDLIQGIISSLVIAVGLVVIIVVVFGGFGPLYQKLFQAAPENLTITLDGAYTYQYWSSIIITGSLGLFAWASMFNRIYAAKSVKTVKRATWWGAIITVVFSALVLILGLGVKLLPEAMEAGEQAFFWILNSVGGPILMSLGGIVVIAASMSLIDSVITTHGVIIAENLIKYTRPNLPSERRVTISRIAIVIYIIVALVIAMLDLPNLAHIAIILYEGLLQIVPVLLFAMFWKRSNKHAALWGMLVGLAVAIVFAAIPTGWEMFGGWTPGIIGCLANLVIHVILGFALKKEAHVDELFAQVKDYDEARELETAKA
ncbi:MAG: sodium:solute symporter family protein [Spirochaetaceae bacterium]|nr:MAG: sodium:solute symporter family protein [Spirochaetaceae bacterium]